MTMSTFLYVSSDDLKATLELQNETYADPDIDNAVLASSRVIDAYKGTRFFPTAESRLYTPPDCRPASIWPNNPSLGIYDLCGLDTLTVDLDGSGAFATTWTRDLDFYLEPINADLTGKPWNQISLRWQGSAIWPPYQYSVNVGGTFGWSTAPAQVTESCGILAARYLKRARETPYGMVMMTTETDALAARLARTDPDVSFMLDGISDEDVPTLIL